MTFLHELGRVEDLVEPSTIVNIHNVRTFTFFKTVVQGWDQNSECQHTTIKTETITLKTQVMTQDITTVKILSRDDTVSGDYPSL